MKNEKMEIFKKNMEEAGFTTDFIGQALQYFNELREEGEFQELPNLIDVIDYYSKIGSFTCNSLQSFCNLYNFREDLNKLFEYDSHYLIDYFYNIEGFELQVVYMLFYDFYPLEEEDIN